ncbi:efflux RND transporter periplasmic adaptor subunit [Sphingomonas nostoxanthinifaciens]|nr:efflux RND transporter periplasmic adaptor subunit [Sphingomonas nostoxanthinifaciens]
MEHSPPDALPATRRMPSSAQYRLLALALLAVVALFAVIALIRWATATPPPPVETTPPGTFRPTAEQRATFAIKTVGNGDAMDVIGASGTIGIDQDRSTPVVMPYGGQVVSVAVEAGEMVRQGQALLTIRTGDVVDARNALLAAAAAQANAASQLRTAQTNVKRQEEIYRTAGGALRDYQQAQNDLVAAQAAARSAEAALGAARDKLAIFGKSPAEISAFERSSAVGGIDVSTVLRAPISGIVADRSISPGEYVGAGGDKPVMTIADPTHLWLVAQLAESDAAQVHVGDPVEVTTPAFPGRTFRAVIDNIAAALDPVTHRLPVRASIFDATRSLKPQMFASFTILRPVHGQTLAVPAGAVIHEGDSARVWVARPDGLLASRDVQLGDAENGMVRIVGGLRPGERVVTSGAIFVNEAGIGQ